MKKSIIFLIFLLILINSCSKEETVTGDNHTSESIINSTYFEVEQEIVKKDKATLNINIIKSRSYEDNEAEKGNFFVLELVIDNLDNYSGFVELKASCLRRDEEGSITLGSVRYRKIGKVEEELNLKRNEVGTFKVEGCFEKIIGKTDRIAIDNIEAYRFI